MTDRLLPLHLRHARTSFSYRDATGISRGMFGAPTKTAARGVDHLAATLEFTKHGGKSTDGRSERALLRSWLASLRGSQNRAYLFDKSYRRRGSFPTGELLTNNTFASGTTGWLASSEMSISAQDRVLRATRTSNQGAARTNFGPSAAAAVTQYSPHVLRVMAVQGRGYPVKNNMWRMRAGSTNGNNDYGETTAINDNGLLTFAFTPPATSAFVTPLVDGTGASGWVAGDYFMVPYVSLSRCLLADIGTNLLLRSDEFENAAWSLLNATVSANATTAPDGATTAESIIEDVTAAAFHGISQTVTISSATGDYCIAAALKAGTRSWARLVMQRNSNQVNTYFDLTNGVVGSGTTGTNWADRRAFIRSLGNGWFYCAMVARSSDTTTSFLSSIRMATGDGVSSYSGDGASNIFAWRATVARSSVPVRLVQTTSAASNGTSPTGSSMYIKGGPASALGSLLVDDQFEIITSRGSELKILTAPVDFDAAGLGYMQFVPPLVGTVSDNAAVIIHQPMGYFLFTGNEVGWDNDPGFWTTASAEFEEAI